MKSTMSATQPSVSMEKSGVAPPETLDTSAEKWRAVIDTSAPFESVKEAVNRFGGSAFWKSQLKQHFHPGKHQSVEEFDFLNVQEQTAQMEKDLIAKERETLEVLKELERTKRIVDSLKLRLHEESAEVNKFHETHSDNVKLHPVLDHEENITSVDSLHAGMHAKQHPCSILVELKQAKMNLSRTTSNLAGSRASIESLSTKVEEEKALLKKTREKLSSSRALVSSLEEDLKLITLKLQLTEEVKHLLFERDQFRHATGAAKSEVSSLILEIERMKAAIKATEMRCISAKKMVLPIEEYAILTQKVQEADESSRKKIEAAMLEMERVNQSKMELIAKVEEAAEDLKTQRKVLEQALNREEAANEGKRAVEEALRRWRFEHVHKGRHIYNSTKFKNSYPGHKRMLDRSELNLVTDDPRNELKHTLSIGEILSRKLMGPDDYDIGIFDRSNDKATVSLGQIINRRQGGGRSARTKHPAKRKKFVFVGFSHISINDTIKSKNTKRKQISGPR